MTRPVDKSAAPLLCATWVAFAALSVLLSLLAAGGVFGDRLLPPWAAVTLACTELTLLALATLAAAGISALLERTSRFRWLIRPARCAGAAALLLAYATSWAAFWVTGQFLDREAVGLVVTNGAALLRYVSVLHGPLLVATPLAVLAAAFLATEVLPRLIAKLRPVASRRLVYAGSTLAALCAIAAVGGDVAARTVTWRADDPATGIHYALEELYPLRRDSRAGPFTHAISDLVDRPGSPQDGHVAAGPGVVRRPVVPMAQWLAGADPARVNRMNVVVIVVDSLRADQLRAGGAVRDVMPNVDALAREGRFFSDCVAQATHTDYSAPTPLSSHYPLRSRATHRYPERPTYPRVMLYDILKPLGYRTAIFSSQNENWQQMVNHLSSPNLDRYGYPDRMESGNPEFSVDDRFAVEEAVRWVDAVSGDPFFIFMNLQNGHVPYPVPDGFARPFGRAPDFPLSFGCFPKDRVDDVKDLYADSLAYVDSLIGRLVERVRARGLWDRTVFVVTADHGEAFYEHGFAAHGSALYGEVVRVPLVIRAPGLEPGVDGRPAQIIDVAPSVLHLLGLASHPSFQGADLFDPEPEAHRARFMVAHTTVARQYAVIRSGRKLIYDGRLRRWTLYDLELDPQERRDVSGDRPEELRDLQAALAAWYRAQIDYYADPRRHAVEYPPSLTGGYTRRRED